MAMEVSNRGVRRSLIWVLGCLAATLALPATASASQTFTNSAPIPIKDGDCGMSTGTQRTSACCWWVPGIEPSS
jgi:hypothetical protein